MLRLKYWAFPHLAYLVTHAPRCLFPCVLKAWGWGTWLPWRMRPMSERSGWPWALLFVFLQRQMFARGFPRRSSDGADHVRTGSDCYFHSDVPKTCYTGRRRRWQQTHVVVITCFVVGALRCCVRFSRSRRVRTHDNHSPSDASLATSNGGSRRLRSRSPIKQRANFSVLGYPALARAPFYVCHRHLSKATSRHQ
jgi:hypothetical protein